MSNTAIDEGLIQQVADFVNERDYVSFVEMTHFLEGKIPTEGHMAICHPGHDNLIIWAGISNEMVELLGEMKNRDIIRWFPTDTLVYMIDGGMLNFPVYAPKRGPIRNPAKPHWTPSTIRPAEKVLAYRKKKGWE